MAVDSSASGGSYGVLATRLLSRQMILYKATCVPPFDFFSCSNRNPDLKTSCRHGTNLYMCRRKKLLKENGRFFVLRTKSTGFYTKFRLPLNRCHIRNIDIHQSSKASLNSAFFKVYFRYIYGSMNRFLGAQRIFYDARFIFFRKMSYFASKYLCTLRCVAHQSKRHNESFRMMCIGLCISTSLMQMGMSRHTHQELQRSPRNSR